MQDQEVKLRAAIQFKNYIVKEWSADEITQVDMQLRQIILPVYMNCSKVIASVLEDAVFKFGASQYYELWRGFTQLLCSFFQSQNMTHQIRSLIILEKVIEKYEYAQRSDPLYQEIIYVVTDFHNALF